MRRIIVATLLIGCVLALTGRDMPASASQPAAPPAQDGDALVVNAGIYVLSAGQYDVSTGSYVVDMYLTLECSAPCAPDRFEFMNGRATSSDLVEDEPDYKSYRIQAALQSEPDLRDYPFDSQTLVIEFEDKSESKSRLVYAADPDLNGVDPSVIIAGWQIANWNAEVVVHEYPTFDATYSRFRFSIVIERGALSSVFKAIMPALFIVLSGFLALLLGPREALQRLGINTAALVGGMLFHVNLTSQLPPVGYLTLADKYMIMNYVGLIGALIATVALLSMSARQDDGARAMRLHRLTAVWVPVVWVVGQVIVFATR